MLSPHLIRSFAPQPATRSRRMFGFTLIELMVVAAIVAILAAIAYPSYRSQVRKTRRADAQSVLMQAAQFMERSYTENGCYNPTGCSTTATSYSATAASPGFAMPFTKSPVDGTTEYYRIRVTSVKNDAFTLTATPQGAEAPDGTTMTLDNTGARTGWEP